MEIYMKFPLRMSDPRSVDRRNATIRLETSKEDPCTLGQRFRVSHHDHHDKKHGGHNKTPDGH